MTEVRTQESSHVPPSEDRTPLPAANDNGSTPMPSDRNHAVVEVDLWPATTKTINDLLRGYLEPDLSGASLFQAARQVARGIYMSAQPDTRDVLADFAHGKTDVLIVRNLFSVPTDLEPTPNCRQQPSTRSRIFALANAGLALAAGQLPISVSNENQGQFDRHVRPVLGQAHLPSSTGAAELGPHTEHSFRSHGANGLTSPQVDTLCLSGIRNEGAEPTGFAALSEVLPRLRPASIGILLEPVWGMDPPDSSEANGTIWGIPILYWRHGRVECAYRADKVHIPNRPGAHDAIQDLNLAISQASRAVVLSPGTAWLARNPRCFHWRDEVKNPTRWLVRTFGLAPHTAAIFGSADRPDLMQY
jgi:hypothetical protein